jgi:hypothetical protein
MYAIDSYQFGQIVVNGQRYSSDVVIFPDRVKDNWYRWTGHQLHLDDLSEAIAENPEVLIIGTGAAGMLRVMPEITESLEAKGITLIAQPTDEACQIYNQLCLSRRVVAAFHLTC